MTRRLTNVLLLIGLLALATACKVTPSYVERWEDREGSEEKFIEWLQDSDIDYDARVRSLEMLVQYWRYSSPMMRNGAPLAEITDVGTRESIIRDAIPEMNAIYSPDGDERESETIMEQIRTADAAFQIAQTVEDAELRGQLQEIVANWLNDAWEPCVRPGASMASVPDFVSFVGRERGMARIRELVEESSFREYICVLEDSAEVEWRNGDEELTEILKTKLTDVGIPESPQTAIEFLDQFVTVGTSDEIRSWMFEQIASDDLEYIEDSRTDAVVRGYLVRRLMETTRGEDRDSWIALLEREDTNRWSAFQALVRIGNADGIEDALSNLPAESDYAFFEGSRRTNGFRSSTERICGLPRVEDVREEARDVFEAHVTDENIYARAIAIACLGKHGNDASVGVLRRAVREMGGERNDEVPYWLDAEGEAMTFTDLVDEAIVDIETPDPEPEDEDADAEEEDAEEGDDSEEE